MPWDDPPRDDGSWDPSSRDEIDLGRVDPSKDGHRQDATSVGSDRGNSAQMRNDHDAENNDSHDDDETFYKRYSKADRLLNSTFTATDTIRRPCATLLRLTEGRSQKKSELALHFDYSAFNLLNRPQLSMVCRCRGATTMGTDNLIERRHRPFDGHHGLRNVREDD